MNEPRQAVAYMRASVGDEPSIEYQRIFLEGFAQGAGYSIVNTYQDTTPEQGTLDLMIQHHGNRGERMPVLVLGHAQLSRSGRRLLALLATLGDAGFDVVFARDGQRQPTITDLGSLILRMVERDNKQSATAIAESLPDDHDDGE